MRIALGSLRGYIAEMSESSSNESERHVGFMSHLSNARVVVVGLLVVSMSLAGLAFIPTLVGGDPTAHPSDAPPADSFKPTPVGEDEEVYKAHGVSVSRKQVQEMLKPYASARLLDALADPGSAPPDLATNMSATLSSVISADLIAQEVAEANVGASDAEVKEKLEAFIAEHFKDRANYEEALKHFDLTEEGMLQQLRFPIEAERLTDSRYPINDADVQAQVQPLYDEKYKSGKVVRHMQFTSIEDADNAMARLIAGEDFAEVAKELSKDPITAKEGGLIGPYRPGLIDESFDKAVSGTAIGKLGGPYEGTRGWHIIKVEAVPSLDEARDELLDQARKGIQAQNWVTLAEEIETKAGISLDERFGHWKGMAFGGITPAFEARLKPQPAGTFNPKPAPSNS